MIKNRTKICINVVISKNRKDSYYFQDMQNCSQVNIFNISKALPNSIRKSLLFYTVYDIKSFSVQTNVEATIQFLNGIIN